MALQTKIANIVANFKESFTGFVSTIDSDHSYIHAGKGFSIPVELSMASGSTAYLSLTTPAATSGYVHFRPTNIVSTATAIKAYIYEDQSSTGGSDISSKIVNRNRNSTATTGVTIKSGVTVTVSGDPIQMSAAGSAGGPTSRAGGETGANEEFVLLPETEYIIRIVEAGSAATTVVATAFWYEEETGV